MNTTKELFKKFAFGYIAAGHTQTDESEEELKQLIAEFVENIIERDCFDRNTMLDLLYYVEEHITDENKGFYTYYMNDFRYTCHLEDYIKHVIQLFKE